MSIITLNVNTTFDENDGNSSGSGLSLRDAIITANNDINNDYIIQLQGGETYFLTEGSANEDAGLGGDLDIKNGANVTITTVGNSPATINASTILNNGDRVLHVLSGGALTLEKVVVTGGRVGGGIYNSGTLNVFQTTINGNSNNGAGGGIYNNSGGLTIAHSTISGNSASGHGGGIESFSSTPVTISNSTISGNIATGSGGGIINWNNMLLINTTVTNNTANANSGSGDGGGISNQGSLALRNTIVAGNFDTPNNAGLGTKNPDITGSVQGNANNLIGNLTGASGTIGTGSDIVLATGQNAGLGPLQNNGGITKTHALLTGSPAINAGLTVLIGPDLADIDGDGNKTEVMPLDQRGAGFVRVSGSSVDIGAFEVQATTALPTLAINDVTITEGNSGTTNAVFTVTRTGTATNAITVNYATADGTSNPATAGSDYTATSGTLTFATNETSKTITVPIIGDTTIEPNETFFVNLSSATNATIADAQGLGTITTEDIVPFPTLAINDVTITEGNSGTTNAVFTVTRTGTATNAITVNYATANGTTNPATAGSDYTATNGILTFATNETSKTITVAITGDTTIEPNETFFVNLSSATNATIADAQGLGTITTDDVVLPTLAINDVTITEGNSGTTNAVFTVTRTGTATNAITVNYATANGTSNPATAGSDYTATNGTLTFATNETSKTITVPIIGDTASEANETFFVNLSSATNATIADNKGLGTITNDDVSQGLVLLGTANADSLTGENFNDTLKGYGGNDTLTGAGGNDNLNGGTGNDRLDGGTENDTLLGQTGNDTLIGGTGNDVLTGAAGTDSLTGGSGLDKFAFKYTDEGIDKITDFTVVDDTITVSASGFESVLTANAFLGASQFILGSAATTTSHRFGYNSSNGALWFDEDGTGIIPSIQFATLSTGLSLTNQDIFVES